MKNVSRCVSKISTLPETNSSPLKIGRNPKGNSSSNIQFSGPMLVSGRVVSFQTFKGLFYLEMHEIV